MRFAWDEKKNRDNYQKHGVWFDEAQTVWADESAKEFFDPEHSETEDRFFRIGFSSKSRLLLVVFCERKEKGEEECIRIISARRATTQEQNQYEEGI